MENTSILDRPFVENILTTARHNLEMDGALVPMAFARLGDHLVVPVGLPDLPNDGDPKRMLLIGLGAKLRAQGQEINEAIMLVETWFVDGLKHPNAAKTRPSQHPARQEAIVVVGRNAANTRHTTVIQPFMRDDDNQPVWLPIPVADYNMSGANSMQAVGLLDFLFDPQATS